MKMGKQAGLATLAALVVVSVAGIPSIAQDPAGSKPAATTSAPLTKKKSDPARRVPDYFGQIGLTPEQRTSIYALQAKHQEKIDALEQQIAAEKATMLGGCEAVLTDIQKKLLGNLRQAAAEGPARTTPAPNPSSSTTTPKTGG